MNKRDLAICKKILEFLDLIDDGLALEVLIHAGVSEGNNNPPSLSELERCIKLCDGRGWIVGVASKHTGKMKWGIKDEGRAALLEMA